MSISPNISYDGKHVTVEFDYYINEKRTKVKTFSLKFIPGTSMFMEKDVFRIDSKKRIDFEFTYEGEYFVTYTDTEDQNPKRKYKQSRIFEYSIVRPEDIRAQIESMVEIFKPIVAPKNVNNFNEADARY